MARAAKESDFPVDVEGIGRFKFARRTQRDKYQIRSLYAQLTNDYYKEDGTAGDMEAWFHATLSVLTVEEPADFSVEKLDPLLDDVIGDKLMKVYSALREKELSFRPPTPAAVATASPAPG